MRQQLLRVGSAAGVRTLTLDSPANRNALSTPLLEQLAAALADAVADPAVRLLVLDHTGPVFCSGADLAETAAARAAGRLPVEGLADLLADLWSCPKPVVARVAGPVRAGGIGLVAAADIALCAREATFAFTEVRLGLVPAVISAVVLTRMDRRAAERFFLTGEIFPAPVAAAAGLITEAVPAADLDAAVARVCEDLRRGAPAALTGAKRLLRGPEAGRLRSELAELTAVSAGYFRSADAAEGIRAFREKRPPGWVLDERG